MTRTIVLPEIVVPGKRLGRNIHHDPRSLAYLLPDSTVPAVSVEWERHIPILDQGQLGSCTGNAMVGALGSGPLWDALENAGELDGNSYREVTLNEAFAVSIYSDAEKLDGGAGLPSEDQGSSGLSVAKVAHDDGFISGYQHATSLAAAHTALAAGPFILGTYWYSGMDEPTPEGVVTATGQVRGGHEYLCRRYDADRDLWWMDNSWGTGFGVDGRFAYDSATLSTLLAHSGDITSLVPLDQPAPTPTPAPTGGVTRTWTDPADVAALDKWAARRTSSPSASAAWKRGDGPDVTASAARHRKPQPAYRDAGTGRYVTSEYGHAHGDTTVGETR